MSQTRFLQQLPILLLLALCQSSAFPQTQDFWQQTNGPFGGRILSITFNPAGYIFAGTQGGGVFRSTNRGDSWSYAGLLPLSITALATDTSGFVYAGTIVGDVWRSTDNGNNWILLDSTGFPRIVRTLTIAPNGHIFAGTSGGLYRSIDYGGTWAQINTGLTNTDVSAILITTGTIFVGTGSGVFRSTNNGDTWVASNTGLSSTDVRSIVVSSISKHLFASTIGGGVFRSTDNGTNWTPSNSGLSDTWVFSLSIDVDGRIFAGTTQGVFLSTNNGASWTQTNTTRADFLLTTPARDIFAGTYQGVFRSQNNGFSWEQKNNGIIATDVRSLLSNPRGTEIIAGTFGNGIFRSTDNGASWESISEGLRIAPFYSLPIIFSLALDSSGFFYAATSNGVFSSFALLGSWQEASSGLTSKDVRAVCVGTSGSVFAGTVGGGVFRSTNYGTSWTPVNNGLTNSVVPTIAVNRNGDVFVGTNGGGIFRSTDNGDNWTAANAGLANLNVHSLGVSVLGTLLAGTDGGLFRSTDNGQSWTKTSTGRVYAITFVSSNDVYVGTPVGIFRSTDGGLNWSATNTGLSNRRVLSLAISRTGYLFAGTGGVGGSGVFRSTQVVTSLSHTNSPLPVTFSLEQNYPNPFNPRTTIKFQIPSTNYVTLKVYTMLGQEVATLVNEELRPGSYKVIWDVRDLPSGVYFYRLGAGSFTQSRKLVLLR